MPAGLTPLNLQDLGTAKPQEETETFKATRKRIKQEMIKPRQRKTNIQSKENESKARNDKTTKKKEENGENKRPFKSWNFQRIK
jgi:hypothetical protein